MTAFAVNDKTLGTGRTYVVAEMAWSHDGRKDLALQIVRAAAAAGADAVSVHVTNVPAYMVPHYGSGKGRVSAGKDDTKIFQYLCDINIRDEWWPEIFAAARKAGLAVATMPNDAPSLDLCRTLGPDWYVIHAACFTDDDHVRAVAAEGKCMLLRVGGATVAEIAHALDICDAAGCPQAVLLWGQQNYPTKIDHTDLAKLGSLRQMFHRPVGLADHVDADDPFAAQLPLMAVAMGAAVVEKHLTHDRAAKGEDHESALNGDELAALVQNLRKAEAALGNGHFLALGESQDAYRLVSRKRVVAARDIPAGTTLTRDLLTCKRSDAGLFPEDLPRLLGRAAARDLPENEGIDLDAVR